MGRRVLGSRILKLEGELGNSNYALGRCQFSLAQCQVDNQTCEQQATDLLEENKDRLEKAKDAKVKAEKNEKVAENAKIKAEELIKTLQADKEDLQSRLNAESTEKRSFHQQTTDLLEENKDLQADKEALQAKLEAAEQTLQEIEGGTPNKAQQAQSSYIQAENHSLGMAGVHKEHQEQLVMDPVSSTG